MSLIFKYISDSIWQALLGKKISKLLKAKSMLTLQKKLKY